MKTSHMLACRTALIGFWVCIIFLFLFIPYYARYFYEQKSLNIFIWPMILDAHIFTEFEKKTGIKVYINYYESNEELYSKLQATGGKGYDIIVPTDYMVAQLIQDGLIKKIDMSQIAAVERLQPFLRGNYYDPHNEYSLPYYMTIFGLGINTKYVPHSVDESWDLAFDKNKIIGHISMIDSPREAVLLAGKYLFGSIDHINDEARLQRIEQLLIAQKEWVETYTSARAEELLAAGNCAVAVGTSTDIWKAAREYPFVQFILPKEGSFLTVDSFVIPKTTDKDALIYELLNFLYQPHIIEHNCAKYGFCPPTTDSVVQDSSVLCVDEALFKKLDFFRNILTREQIQNIWIAVKAY